MTPEIKEFTVWADAARWLAKHGWGLGLIEQQKELWDAANAVEVPKEKVATPSKEVTTSKQK